MWLIKTTLQTVIAAAIFLLIASAVQKHLQTACYLSPSISSKSRAIAAAKELIIKARIFEFPDVGSSRDFVTSLDRNAKCCGARKEFSFFYLSSVWEVDLVSQEYATFVVMDECGQRIFRRGSTANL